MRATDWGGGAARVDLLENPRPGPGRAATATGSARLARERRPTVWLTEAFVAWVQSAAASLDASVHPVQGTTLRLTLRPFEVATLLLFLALLCAVALARLLFSALLCDAT